MKFELKKQNNTAQTGMDVAIARYGIFSGGFCTRF